ncbi:2'-5' RNA ligase family protein [Solicola sp. PLA-1-18]|uniref:2'-5' RNA ligase family protein n=1 Tax=Solicola sp. PLA-1-18 TaxID=3380532 RepID=UPI003B7AAE67
MLTIGVAVPVPEPWGEQLRSHRAAFGDPAARTVPTHVTLLPPQQTDGDLDTVYERLSEAAAEHRPYRIHLRGTGTFRPISPVVFVAVAEGISPTELLAKSVRAGLLKGDLEFPYHPHVTVAHHLDDEALDRAFDELAEFECTFDVTAFSLYVHDERDGWITHREFAL